MRDRFLRRWRSFWLSRGGFDRCGRLATSLGRLGVGSDRQLYPLAWVAPTRGYIDPSARAIHVTPRLGRSVFIGERVVMACWPADAERGRGGLSRESDEEGFIALGDGAQANRECVLEIFAGGSISIGVEVGLQMRCALQAAVHPISIGRRAMIAPFCILESGARRTSPESKGAEAVWESKGPIVIEEDAWLGVGVKVLSGVTIGEGAVVAAGSVVVRDIPAGAIAAGNPAEIIRHRKDLVSGNR